MAVAETKYNLKKQIQLSLIELLASMEIEKITIKQITTHSFTSRTHFYYYFSDKYDVLKSIREDCFSSIQLLLNGNSSHFVEDFVSPEELYQLSYQNTLDILNHLKTEQAIFKSMLLNDNLFEGELYNLYYRHFLKSLPSTFVNTVTSHTLTFISQGIFQIYMNWLKTDCRETSEGLCEVITRLLITSLEHLMI